MMNLASKEQRILILAPLGADATLTQTILGESGVQCEICTDTDQLLSCLQETYGAVLIADEALDFESIVGLNATLREQEPWSDIPIVLLTSKGESTEAEFRRWNAFASRGNVTVLERPVRTSTLISAVQVALRARLRQYEVRKLLEEHKAATQLRDEFISIASHELKTPITSSSRPPKMEFTGTLVPQVIDAGGQKFKYKLQTKLNSYFLTFSAALIPAAKSNEWNEVVVRGIFDFDLYAIVVDDIRRLQDKSPAHRSDLWAC